MKLFIFIAIVGVAAVLAHPKAAVHQEVAFDEDELVAALSKRQSDFMSLSGPVVTQMLKKVLTSPILKKIATPENFKTFLNSESTGAGIFSQENIDLIMNSDVFKALVTPEMFHIVLDSKAAKQIFNKDMIRMVLSHPVIVKFLTPETVMNVLNADVVANVIDPALFKWILEEAAVFKNIFSGASIGGFMTTKVWKALIRYEFIHLFVYSELGQAIFTPGLSNGFLNNEEIVNLFTPANIADLLKSPVMNQIFDVKVFLDGFDTKLAHALLNPAFIHEILYSELFFKLVNPDVCEQVLNKDAVKAAHTPAAVADYTGCQSFKTIATEEHFKKIAATETIKNIFHNPAVKTAFDQMHAAFTA